MYTEDVFRIANNCADLLHLNCTEAQDPLLTNVLHPDKPRQQKMVWNRAVGGQILMSHFYKRQAVVGNEISREDWNTLAQTVIACKDTIPIADGLYNLFSTFFRRPDSRNSLVVWCWTARELCGIGHHLDPPQQVLAEIISRELQWVTRLERAVSERQP